MLVLGPTGWREIPPVSFAMQEWCQRDSAPPCSSVDRGPDVNLLDDVTSIVASVFLLPPRSRPSSRRPWRRKRWKRPFLHSEGIRRKSSFAQPLFDPRKRGWRKNNFSFTLFLISGLQRPREASRTEQTYSVSALLGRKWLFGNCTALKTVDAPNYT